MTPGYDADGGDGPLQGGRKGQIGGAVPLQRVAEELLAQAQAAEDAAQATESLGTDLPHVDILDAIDLYPKDPGAAPWQGKCCSDSCAAPSGLLSMQNDVCIWSLDS